MILHQIQTNFNGAGILNSKTIKDHENEQYQCTRHAISMERRGS